MICELDQKVGLVFKTQTELHEARSPAGCDGLLHHTPTRIKELKVF